MPVLNDHKDNIPSRCSEREQSSQGLLNVVRGDSVGEDTFPQEATSRLALGRDDGEGEPGPLAQLSGSLGF